MDVHILGQPGTNKIQQVGLMVGRPQRRGADVLGAVETVAQVLQREEEILGAGLGEDVAAGVPGLRQLLHRDGEGPVRPTQLERPHGLPGEQVDLETKFVTEILV